MGEYTTLYILCKSDLNWKPTEEQLLEIVAHFECIEYDSISVTDYSDDGIEEQENILFVKNIPKYEIVDYYRKYGSYVVLAMFGDNSVRPQIEDTMNSIPESIKGSWVPWSVFLPLGPSPVMDIFSTNVECACNCCMIVSGDGMPADIEKCHEVMAASAPVVEICNYMETLNGQKWTTHISCSF